MLLTTMRQPVLKISSPESLDKEHEPKATPRKREYSTIFIGQMEGWISETRFGQVRCAQAWSSRLCGLGASETGERRA